MYLLPKPKKKSINEDVLFLLSEDRGIAYKISNKKVIKRDVSKEMLSDMEFLKEIVLKFTGQKKSIVSTEISQADIVLNITKADTADESYTLKCKDGIEISGSTTGIWYGIQTLKQILMQCAGAIPEISIKDKPDFAARGLFFDTTRGRVPKLDYLKKLVDQISSYKMNQLHLYIEHTFMFDDMSEVWRDDTPLTAEDIYELDDYCNERHVELVPAISTFGHLYKVLRTRSYRNMCEREDLTDEKFTFEGRMNHHTLDVTNPESLDFAKKLIRRYSSLFTSDKFNICCDETFDLGKGKSKKLAEEEGTQKLYVDFVKELCSYVKELGKTPMFWGDIIAKSPEYLPMLPEGTICLNWGYDPNETSENTGKITASGGRVYNCPGVQGWNQFVNHMHNSYENITKMVKYGEKYGCEGILNTDWGDFGHVNDPDFGRVGRIYGASFSWNADDIKEKRINKMISLLEYADKSEEIVDLLSRIAKKWTFTWWNLCNVVDGVQEPFKIQDMKDVYENTDDLNELADKITMRIKDLDYDSRKLLPPYILAIEGMILVQKVGFFFSAEADKTAENVTLCANLINEVFDPKLKNGICDEAEYKKATSSLAEQLESWFYRYKCHWRESSRESELYHVQDIINVCADALRS